MSELDRPFTMFNKVEQLQNHVRDLEQRLEVSETEVARVATERVAELETALRLAERRMHCIDDTLGPLKVLAEARRDVRAVLAASPEPPLRTPDTETAND